MRLLIVLFIGCTSTVTLAADWLQFRGTRATGSAGTVMLPTDGDFTKQVAWKKPVPGRSVAGPIVIGDRVISTGSGGVKDDHLYVVCNDAQTGDVRWQREFWATGRTMHHPTSANAAPSPASDGKLIFAFFSSNDLICLDLDGNLKWLRGLTADYPAAFNDTGMASSPAIVGDTVVVQVECQGDSFAAGLDKHTGDNRWRIDRPKSANWTTPVALAAPSGSELVLLQSGKDLGAYDPLSGELVWQFKADCSTIPSPLVVDQTIYVPAGGLTAIAPPRDKTGAPAVLWKENKLSPDAASPIIQDNRLYTINSAGVLACADAKDGNLLWQLRLSGKFWATPVLAADHLYAVNQDGLLQVVKLGEKGAIVAKHDLGEQVLGTPAIANEAMFIRSGSSLWKIAQQ